MSSVSAVEGSKPLPAALSLDAGSRKALFWDRIAPKYAGGRIADYAGYEATLVRVQGLLSREHDVLEVGCGTGSTALRLAPHTRSLLATDVSAQMIGIARQRLAAQPTPQLRFAVEDAEDEAPELAAYDVVLAFNVLHLMADLDEALCQLVHRLRPGGLLISKTACVAEMNPLVPYLAVPLMRALGKVPPVLILNVRELQDAMVRQHLEIVSTERHGTQGKDIRAFVVARKPS
jgi:SAM-dependent methyltransferase